MATRSLPERGGDIPMSEGDDREEEPSTRDRILSASLEIAGGEGIEALTTRRVAREAGVNVGLLHYYFSSKDALVEETLGGFLEQMIGFSEPKTPGGAPRDGEKPDLDEEELAAMLTAALAFAARRPGLVFGLVGKLVAIISKTSGKDPAAREAALRAPSLPAGAMLAVQRRLYARLKPLLAARLGDDEDLIARRAIQLFTSLFHPVVLSPFPAMVFGLDLTDRKTLETYVRGVVSDALRPPSSPATRTST
jgi:AcrR family transcriptional regulator